VREATLGSTYRIQVQTLGFDTTRRLVPYLAALGIQTLYLSPLFAAAPGSTHGYDVVDPGRVDPALGTAEDLEALFDELLVHGMRVLLDIVPNHMAAVPENDWWWDVLRRGKASVHVSKFDIDWSRHQGRVLVPVLSRPLADVLAAGRFSVESAKEELEADGIRFPLAAGTPDGSHSDVVRHQHYRPAYWRASATQGNYRRFFDINSLIAVRVEEADVFEATHALIAALAGHAAVAGVRVDHVDGLTDPARYLKRLKDRLPGERAIVIEKILGQGETINPSWPVEGTSGYEFADRVMALFVDHEGAARLRAAGELLCGQGDLSFSSLTRNGKREVLQRSFCADIDHLVRLSLDALDTESPGHDLSEHDLRDAWTELSVSLPVYRTYIDEDGASESDRVSLDAALLGPPEGAEPRRAAEILHVALRERARAGSPWLGVARRWQQLSGAAMAKGSEDTAIFRYPGLLARADVGGDPDSAGDELERFHEFAAQRAGGLNATSTHDSKRNEDARSRLAVLSEADSEWMTLVHRWHAAFADRGFAVHPAEEHAIYQTFLSLWPAAHDEVDDATLARITQQAIKAARESKLRSSWSDPDTRYESELTRFVDAVNRDSGFRQDMTTLGRRVAPLALVNSVASVVLKVCVPGVPDFYQGTEFVEATLTDPDNRRPVDFAARAAALASLPEPSALAATEVLARWHSSHLKMYVMRTLLQDRLRHPALYARGCYEPLPTTTRHAVAFRRTLEDHGDVVCVVPRLTYRLAGPAAFPIGNRVWKEDTLTLPRGAAGRYHDLLSDRPLAVVANELPLSQVLDVLPVAVLRGAA
jgi:malto-oligosyltrehalose synthase